MKTLYFLRHAKAESGSKVVGDKQRALSPRGVEACETMGGYMKAKAYLPDLVLVSSSARTKETLERVAEAAGAVCKHRFEDGLYLATAEEILRIIHETEDSASSLMVVGHNPGMHHIALLLGETHESPLRKALELKYPTCALTVLRFAVKHWADVAPSEGKLIDFVTPGEL